MLYTHDGGGQGNHGGEAESSPAGAYDAPPMPPLELREVDREIRRQARERKMFFHFREGVERYVPMALKPWIVTQVQRRYLRQAGVVLQRAALRVFPAWFERPDLQALLPLTEGEVRWLRESYGGNYRRPETLMSRVDIATDLAVGDWRTRTCVLELNLVGIGAAYYCYCAGQIAEEVWGRELHAKAEDDLLEMIIGRCHEHGAKIGRPKPTVAFVEYRRCLKGPFEYETMCEIYRRRGYDAFVCDTIDVRVKGGHLTALGRKVDLVYRDPTLGELVEQTEVDGDDLRGLKHAFKHNQVVSSLGGEIDHKGLLEVLSAPEYAGLFTPSQRRVLKAIVPWTRVLRDEFADHVRRNRERLVIKPNRDYGGSGVMIGERTSASAWDGLIDEGVRHPSRYVVQERIAFTRESYPILTGRRVSYEKRYTVAGVHATARHSAILGRMSTEPVVNITRGGAIVGVLMR